jgi:hypothetical protein
VATVVLLGLGLGTVAATAAPAAAPVRAPAPATPSVYEPGAAALSVDGMASMYGTHWLERVDVGAPRRAVITDLKVTIKVVKTTGMTYLDTTMQVPRDTFTATHMVCKCELGFMYAQYPGTSVTRRSLSFTGHFTVPVTGPVHLPEHDLWTVTGMLDGLPVSYRGNFG